MDSKILHTSWGTEIIVDKEDYHKYKDKTLFVGVGGLYAMFRGKDNNLFYSHREIMDASAGTQIDHINMDTLDNRRVNLRYATMSQNRANQEKNVYKEEPSSSYKGVCYDKTNGNWLCRVKYEGKDRFNARFKDEHSAALAYNHHAERVFGEFARFNEVPEEHANGNWEESIVTRTTNTGYRYVGKTPNNTFSVAVKGLNNRLVKNFSSLAEAVLVANEFIIESNLQKLENRPRVLQTLKEQEIKTLNESQAQIYRRQLTSIKEMKI